MNRKGWRREEATKKAWNWRVVNEKKGQRGGIQEKRTNTRDGGSRMRSAEVEGGKRLEF